MSRLTDVVVASIAAFAGCLLSDQMYGQEIEGDAISQAMAVAVVAGLVRSWMSNHLVRRDP